MTYTMVCREQVRTHQEPDAVIVIRGTLGDLFKAASGGILWVSVFIYWFYWVFSQSSIWGIWLVYAGNLVFALLSCFCTETLELYPDRVRRQRSFLLLHSDQTFTLARPFSQSLWLADGLLKWFPAVKVKDANGRNHRLGFFLRDASIRSFWKEIASHYGLSEAGNTKTESKDVYVHIDLVDAGQESSLRVTIGPNLAAAFLYLTGFLVAALLIPPMVALVFRAIPGFTPRIGVEIGIAATVGVLLMWLGLLSASTKRFTVTPSRLRVTWNLGIPFWRKTVALDDSLAIVAEKSDFGVVRILIWSRSMERLSMNAYCELERAQEVVAAIDRYRESVSVARD